MKNLMSWQVRFEGYYADLIKRGTWTKLTIFPRTAKESKENILGVTAKRYEVKNTPIDAWGKQGDWYYFETVW